MGNSPSSLNGPSRRSVRKLAKPRAAIRATAGLLSSHVLPNAPGRLSELDADFLPDEFALGLSDPSEDELPRPQTVGSTTTSSGPKVSRRRTFLRSKSSQGPKRSRGKSLDAAAAAAQPQGRLLRSNTVSEWPVVQEGVETEAEPSLWSPSLPPSRRSWAYNLDSYEAKRLLNLGEESATEYQTALSETKMTTISEAEATWMSSHSAQLESAPLSRVNSDLSLYTPVRRRSVIQVPGVATRTMSTRTNSATRSSHRFSHPGSPNLSRQPSMESFRSGILSRPSPPVLPVTVDAVTPRVITPCESEFHAIGAFKLGTLRVVNGPAGPGSPVSGSVSGDYFSRTRQLKTDPAGEFADGVEEEYKTTTAESVSRPDDANHDAHQGPGNVRDSSRARTVSAAHVKEVCFTPVVATELAGPLRAGLATRSKQTALEDMLFEDDDFRPGYCPLEVLDVRVDPSAKSQAPADTGLVAHRTINRTDSGFVSASSPLSEHFQGTLAKTDSGYSSKVALRYFHVKSKDLVSLGRKDTRQHYRNHSTGSVHAYQNPPWRVLHSYNTPAYRNAPIWSG